MLATIANANDLRNSKHQFISCYCDVTLPDMDVRTIRVQRLKALVEKAGGAAAFARAHDGVDATYISQLLHGHRSFGERAARRMEKLIGLPASALDEEVHEPLSVEEERFVYQVRSDIARHAVPPHIQAAIHTLLTGLPPKDTALGEFRYEGASADRGIDDLVVIGKEQNKKGRKR